MVQETIWKDIIDVPEPEFFRHTEWFEEEMQTQREARRDMIVTAVGIIVSFAFVVATFAVYGGY